MCGGSVRLSILLVVVLATMGAVHAQDAGWEQTDGPYGGTYALVASNLQGDLAAIDQEGAGFLSDDGGAAWRNIDPSAAGIAASLVVTEQRKILAGFAADCDRDGCSQNGLYRFDQQENQWMPLALGGLDVVSLTTGPDDRLFAVAVEPGGQGRLHRSLDGGATWESAGPESDVRQVFAGALGTIFLHAVDDGLYRFDAGAGEWVRVLELPSESRYWQFELASRDDGVAVASLGRPLLNEDPPGQVFRSTDDGRTWAVIEGFPAVSVSSILANAEGRFHAATRGLGIFESADGLSWQASDPMLSSALALDLTRGSDGALWTSVAKRGLLRSTGDSPHWEQLPLEFSGAITFSSPIDGVLFAAASVGTVARSTDEGESWELVGPDYEYGSEGLQNHGINSFAVDSERGRLWAGSTNGIVYASDDLGETWHASTPIRDRFPNQRGNISNVVLTPGGNLLAARYNGGVAWTQDDGVTWSLVADLAELQVQAFGVDPDGSLYAGALPCSIYRSLDGTSWTLVTDAALDVSAFAFTTNGNAFAVGRSCAGENGLFRSSDEGKTWIQVFTDPLNGPFSTALLATEADELFLSVTGWPHPGVHRSTDYGETWTDLSTGLAETDVVALALTPDGRLVAGTQRSGILRLSRVATSSDGEIPNEASPLTIDGNYPNPFRDRTTISVSLPEDADVEVVLYDVLGRTVKEVSYGRMAGGSQHLSLEVPGLPSGAYLYRVVAGGVEAVGRMVVH